jgi:outer membrane protein assembly factor BamB
MSVRCSILSALIFASIVSNLVALADWPQLRGPNTDGSAEGDILPNWQHEKPRLLWKRPLRAGFSSFVVVGDRLATLVLRNLNGGPVEVCLCLDAATGAELWAAPLGPGKYTGVGYDSGNYGAPGNQGGDGPRSTPSMDEKRVFAMSSRLILTCFDAATGSQLWRHDLAAEFGGAQILYENAASPLLTQNSVIVAGGGPGESIICFQKTTGAVLWKRHSELLTHSTPTLAKVNGARQAIFYTRSGLVAVDPAHGDIAWRHPFPFRVCAAITPVIGENRVYCSAGYGIGSGVCEVAEPEGQMFATELWRQRHNEPVVSYWSTPVHYNGHLYGMFGFKKFSTAPLKCVDMETGAVKWSQPNFGHGSIILVGDLLVAMAGYGEITLVRPTPAAYRELGRFKALSGKCWSTPAFSNGRLFVRSTTEGACFLLPAAPAAEFTEAQTPAREQRAVLD